MPADSLLTFGAGLLGGLASLGAGLYLGVRFLRRARARARTLLHDSRLEALDALRPGVPTKSGLMLGLGETDTEVLAVLADLRACGVEIVTLGQYLRPTREHAPVRRYVPPADFARLEREARGLGFPAVYSGVFVRSSFNALEVFQSGSAR